MMIFNHGQVAATKVGALPKSKIKEWIEASIRPDSSGSQFASGTFRTPS